VTESEDFEYAPRPRLAVAVDVERVSEGSGAGVLGRMVAGTASEGRRWAVLVALLALLALPHAAAHAGGVPVATATEDQKRAANKLYESGSARSKSGDAKGAFADFRASYDIVASPNTRLRMGRELAAQGRNAEAHREAKATEQMARTAAQTDKKYLDTERSARDDAAQFAKRCGFLRVALVGRRGVLTVAGRPVGEQELASPIAVDPGDVEVTFREAGELATRKVRLSAGAEAGVSFAQMGTKDAPTRREAELVHPFDMGEGQRITGYAVGGVGVIGMGLFIGFGVANLGIYSDLEDQCPDELCPAALEEDADRGRSFQTAANVGLVIGVIGLAGGAGLLIPALVWGDNASSASLQIGPGYAGLEARFR